MKHLGEIIKNHVEANRLVKKSVAEAVGITPTYLSGLFHEASMDCALFERICHVIGLSPAAAFDTPAQDVQIISDIKASTVVGPATVTIGESQALKELLAEKERTIQILMAANGLKIGTKTGHDQ